VARARASCEGWKLQFWPLDEKRNKKIWETYAEFSRKPLCMVMRSVGEEMMMMGWLLSVVACKAWICSGSFGCISRGALHALGFGSVNG
jgi:hypothetical protein